MKLGFSQSVLEEQHLRCLAWLPLCRFPDMPEVQAAQDFEQQHCFVPGSRPVPLLRMKPGFFQLVPEE